MISVLCVSFSTLTLLVECKDGYLTRLVPLAGGPPGASFGFYLREAFQSNTHTEKILYNKSR